MHWERKGLIYKPSGDSAWNQTHAQVPVVDKIDDTSFRIFYATRDKHNISRTSYIEVDSNDPSSITYIHNQPILELGKLGTFDEHGIMPAWILTNNQEKILYYIGWSKRMSVPYHNSIGVAVSTDQGRSFRKVGEGPIMGSILHEPYFTGTCCVLKDQNIWRMWYLSCIGWKDYAGRIEPLYHIKYAESYNGIDWIREGKVAIELGNNEGGIASASVIKRNGHYQMWYAYRGKIHYRTNQKESYKIGYAESSDGINWARKDSLSGITNSNTGWDSEMIAYPHVIEHNNDLLMFYNGNGFGESGFGYAIYRRN